MTASAAATVAVATMRQSRSRVRANTNPATWYMHTKHEDLGAKGGGKTQGALLL
jgi:hypothetical protein